MKLVLPFDHVLATKSGLAIDFKAGVPTYVPEIAVADALAFGAVASDEADDAPAPGNQLPQDPVENEQSPEAPAPEAPAPEAPAEGEQA